MTSPPDTQPSRLTTRWLLPVVVSAAALSVAAAVLSVAAAVWTMQARDIEGAAAGGCACEEAREAAPPVASEARAPRSVEPGSRSAGATTASDTEGPPYPGQSVGSPRDGELFDGRQLPKGEGYFIRNPNRAWATKNTIEHLGTAIAKVRAKFPHIHRLAVGDISNETGGRLNGHLSHQSGRDVDLGLYYRKVPEGYRRQFIVGSRKNLHFRGMMALLEALAETAEHPTGVDWIILDYGLQRNLVQWAKGRGMKEERLEALFQYPAGPTAKKGIVRHFPGHKDHIHVRFKCSADDPNCTSPAIPPVALGSL